MRQNNIRLMKSLSLGKKELDKIAGILRKGIKDKVKESHAKGIVVGLSGGLDSSVVATLAKSAGVNVYGLIIPETGVTSPRDVEDAVTLAEKLKIKYSVIPLDWMLSSTRNSFPWADFPENRKTSWGNAKARLRMTLLYLAANMGKRIVLGTGNRTELMLGYFTKHGDGGADFLPIGSLYKTQIFQLAKHIGLPKEICVKMPSAGLWAGQTDESEIGLSYREMDSILHYLLDKKLSVAKTTGKTKISESKVRKIRRRMQETSHKREIPQTITLE